MKMLNQLRATTKRQTFLADDVANQLRVLFQRTKRDCNVTYMGMIRSLRDRQLELFDITDGLNAANDKILHDQVRSRCEICEKLFTLKF